MPAAMSWIAIPSIIRVLAHSAMSLVMYWDYLICIRPMVVRIRHGENGQFWIMGHIVMRAIRRLHILHTSASLWAGLLLH